MIDLINLIYSYIIYNNDNNNILFIYNIDHACSVSIPKWEHVIGYEEGIFYKYFLIYYHYTIYN